MFIRQFAYHNNPIFISFLTQNETPERDMVVHNLYIELHH